MMGPELYGTKVNLRKLQEEDLLRRASWLNDEETVRLFTGAPPSRKYELADAVRWQKSFDADPTAIVWAIETTDGKHVGDVDLHSIDSVYKTAKLTILIGDKESWNQGCGTDTVKTLLAYAFNVLGLESVDLRVFDFNKRAIRCYEKSGFVQTGFSIGRQNPSEPGEIYMTATKARYLAENPNAVAVSS